MVDQCSMDAYYVDTSAELCLDNGDSAMRLPLYSEASVTDNSSYHIIEDLKSYIADLRREVVSVGYDLHKREADHIIDLFSQRQENDLLRAYLVAKDKLIAKKTKDHEDFRRYVRAGMKHIYQEFTFAREEAAKRQKLFDSSLETLQQVSSERYKDIAEIDKLKKQLAINELEMQRVRKVRDALLMNERDTVRLEEECRALKYYLADRDYELRLVKHERDSVRSENEKLLYRINVLKMLKSTAATSDAVATPTSPAPGSPSSPFAVASKPIPSALASTSSVVVEPVATPRHRARGQTTFARVEQLPSFTYPGSDPTSPRTPSSAATAIVSPRYSSSFVEYKKPVVLPSPVEKASDPVAWFEDAAKKLKDYVETESSRRGCSMQEAGNGDVDERIYYIVSGYLLPSLMKVLEHEMKGNGFSLFAKPTPWDLFIAITISSSVGDPMLKKISENIREVNKFAARATVATGAKAADANQKTRYLLLCFLNNNELHSMVKFVLGHQITYYHYKPAALVRYPSVASKVADTAASLDYLSLHMSLQVFAKAKSNDPSVK